MNDSAWWSFEHSEFFTDRFHFLYKEEVQAKPIVEQIRVKNARNNGEKSTNIGWLVAWMRWKPASCSWVGNSFPKAKVGLAMPSCRRMPHIAPNVARCRLIEWKGGGFLDAENFGAFFQRLLSSKPWRFGVKDPPLRAKKWQRLTSNNLSLDKFLTAAFSLG